MPFRNCSYPKSSHKNTWP